ncbi:hypothetical protein DB42_EM00040 [Neochlamydia sp. EPS4]|nr:hypothetical protein DB42_EM00040 [Neochlamydia sp. EPS4]
MGSDNFSAFLFIKNNIKKLKKQVKRIRILINEKQLTNDLPRFTFRQIQGKGGDLPSI